MTRIVANVPTAGGSRYLQQLCKHWSHKFTTAFTPERGTVSLPFGLATMIAHPDRLEVWLDVTDAAMIERAKEVVASHLDRFAFREAPLLFAWQTAPAG